jgi:hypothetical protein
MTPYYTGDPWFYATTQAISTIFGSSVAHRGAV